MEIELPDSLNFKFVSVPERDGTEIEIEVEWKSKNKNKE